MAMSKGLLGTARGPGLRPHLTSGGRVSSYYLKQLAQATALAVPGAHQIRNDLNVIPPD